MVIGNWVLIRFLSFKINHFLDKTKKKSKKNHFGTVPGMLDMKIF